uniref:Putative polyprotein n=1 Tax=Moniliophthora roreri TaxID=221103 RepID=A0A0W0G151_MONRR
MLQWIMWIQLFDFEPHHIPSALFKGEDGLSRQPRSENDPPVETPEAVEEFIEAYYNVIYGDNIPTDASLMTTTKYTLSLAIIHHSNPFTTPSPTTILLTSSIQFVLSLLLQPHDQSEFIVQTLQNQLCTTIKLEAEYQLGDEVVYFSYMSKIQTDNVVDFVEHIHHCMDEDSQQFWDDLHAYFHQHLYPSWCRTNQDCLRWEKKSQRFFLHDNRLWLAPRCKSQALPRLVIEVSGKRTALIAKVHNEVGHKERDAVHKNLWDRFYWSNLFVNVSYFIHSCIECQKVIKGIPILPYNESWQAPLLQHFNIDCIYMLASIGGVNFIIHAIEPTILWQEVKAVK